MKLKVLGSGSSGNSYLLTDSDNNMLLVECGVHPVEIKKAIDFDLSNVSGVLVTHGHQDHCRAINHLAASGLSIYASKGTLEETNMIQHHRSVVMKPSEQHYIGPYIVKGFEIIHDTKEPFGFLIHHSESGNIVFLTDTVYSKFRFYNIKHWIVEANYDQEIIDTNPNGNTFVRDRVLQSHMSIQTLEKMLAANDLSQTRTIVLTHLSDTNSNQYTAKERIRNRFSKETHIATKDLEISLNKTPF